MSITLFNRYGIHPSGMIKGPNALISFDANDLSLANGASVTTAPIGPYTMITRSGSTNPTYSSPGINNHPALSFTGIDNFETSTVVTELDNTNYSMYVVFQYVDGNNDDAFVRVGTDAANGIWMVSGESSQPATGRLKDYVSGNNNGVNTYIEMGYNKKVVSSIRVDLNLGRKVDARQVGLPVTGTQTGFFTTAPIPPHYQFTGGTGKIGFAGNRFAYAVSSLTNQVLFGEFRFFPRYLTDTEHENTMRELQNKWR